jgi:predicted membrane channel-forming protein YqfA (hemolysin III family)
MGRRLHRSGTLVMSLLMAVIGVALIVEAIVGARHGAVSLLLVMGVLFVAAGVGRLYAERKRGSARE